MNSTQTDRKRYLITKTDCITGDHTKFWFDDQNQAYKEAETLLEGGPLVVVALIDAFRGHVHLSSCGAYIAANHQKEIRERLALTNTA